MTPRTIICEWSVWLSLRLKYLHPCDLQFYMFWNGIKNPDHGIDKQNKIMCFYIIKKDNPQGTWNIYLSSSIPR